MLNPKYLNIFFNPIDGVSAPVDPPGEESEDNSYQLKLKTRREHILAKIAGDSSAKEIKPKTREEYLLLAFESSASQQDGGSGDGK